MEINGKFILIIKDVIFISSLQRGWYFRDIIEAKNWDFDFVHCATYKTLLSISLHLKESSKRIFKWHIYSLFLINKKCATHLCTDENKQLKNMSIQFILDQCQSYISLCACRVTWNYAYSPFSYKIWTNFLFMWGLTQFSSRNWSNPCWKLSENSIF